jgi:hypothetical protein
VPAGGKLHGRAVRRKVAPANGEWRIREAALHSLVLLLATRYRYSPTETRMNEDVFNASIRKFLKTLGVTAQREIEKAVRKALEEGKLKGSEKFSAKATVTLAGIGLAHEVTGEIELE